MSLQFLATTIDSLFKQESFDMMSIYWPVLSMALISSLSVFLTIVFLKKSKSPQQTISSNQRHNLENIYNRIHNYQPDKQTKAPTTANIQHNNASTNSAYYHAIKLIQRGIDTKSLVEYCNLTYGEAELLQTVYGLKYTRSN